MFPPGFALCRVIQQHRLQTVQCGGVLRLWRAAFLEFLPQGHQLIPLLLRQKTEEPVGAGEFAFVLVLLALRIISIGIPRIDLYQVMDQQHLHHSQKINPGIIEMFT